MTETLSPFYVTGGTLRPDAQSYVERRADRDLHQALGRGEFCYVLTSRQMGKSSLMVRTARKLRTEGAAVAVLDLTAIGQNLTPEQWYGGLLRRLGRQLDSGGDLEDNLDDFWQDQERLGPLQRWMAALEQVVLRRFSGPVVLFLDEIDAVRSLPFSTDEFFAGIRECYNRRTADAGFQRLTFCLLGGATPSDLIRDTRVTPFNIGTRVELTDFSPTEALALGEGLGREKRVGALLLQRVLHWTGGHPYLTQRLCRAVAEDSAIQSAGAVDRLCEALFLSHSAREKDDNLLFVRERLLRSEADQAALLDLYAQVRAGKRLKADDTNQLVGILRLSGIARIVEGYLLVRNRIYFRVFDREWVLAHMPDAELQRQKAAYRRGLARAATMASVVLAVVSGLAIVAVANRRLAEKSALLALQRERETRRLLYVSDMNVAQQALDSGNLAQAQELLERHRPAAGNEDLRGFDWRYLWGMSRDQSTAILRKHKYGVMQVAFSPDGRLVASSDNEADAKLWDRATGRIVATVRTQRVMVNALSFSPDSQILALGCIDGTLRLWSVANQHEVGLGKCSSPVWSIAFSPDGTQLASADEDVRLWDLRPLRTVTRLHTWKDTVPCLAFSPDGRLLATTSTDNLVRLWDLTARPRRVVAVLTGHTYPPVALAFSPNGRLLASAGGDKTARIWDVASRREIRTLAGHTRGVPALAFSPDGKVLATASHDGTVKTWDVATFQEILTLRGHTGTVNCLSFSPDGKVLATGSDDTTIRLWKPAAGPDRNVVLRHPLGVFTVALAPGGGLLASGGFDGVIRVWDTATGRAEGTLEGHKSAVQVVNFSPDGRLLASGGQDGTIRLWEVAPGWRCVATVRAVAKSHQRVWQTVFFPDGKRLVSFGDERFVRLWDVTTHKQLGVLPDTVSISSLAISPDGKTLVISNYDGGITLWDPNTRRRLGVLKGHQSGVIASAFTRDGHRLASSSADGVVKVWDLATQQAVATLRAQAYIGNNLAFSPDGKTLAVGGMDGTLQMWNLLTGQQGAALKGHGLMINGLAYTPDWSLLASASDDKTVRLWRAPSFAMTDAPSAHRIGPSSR